jgi:hypothetical protein
MPVRDDDARPDLVEADRLRGVTPESPDPADAAGPGHGPTRPIESGPGTPAEVGRGTAENDVSDDRNLTPGDYDYVPARDRRPGGERADDRAGPGARDYEGPRQELAAGGRHPTREAEAADRVVNKRRPGSDVAGSSRVQSRRAEPTDRELPLQDYNRLTIPQIIDRIPSLSSDELQAIRAYERAHRRRKTLLVRLERQLRNTGAEAAGSEGSPPDRPDTHRDPGY